jgi:hypothetical protein
MQRFKANDGVFILPKYSHLYPGNTAVVVSAIADPFRPMFNEYTVEFANGSTAKLFEFQVIEDFANYQTFIANLVFDSRNQVAAADTRSQSSNGRQIILQTPGFHVDMGIHMTKSRASIMGQVLQRSTKELMKDLEVRLMNEAMPISSVVSDSVGVFKFRHIPLGPMNILVTIHQYFSRILGAFSI